MAAFESRCVDAADGDVGVDGGEQRENEAAVVAVDAAGTCS